jgi:hypothetical protein
MPRDATGATRRCGALFQLATDRAERRGEEFAHGTSALAARVPQELREQLRVLLERFISERFHARSVPRRSTALVTRLAARIAPAMLVVRRRQASATRTTSLPKVASFEPADERRRRILQPVDQVLALARPASGFHL